jgi:60 kDa SS-A/Ro ribonucleoprotein
LKEDIVVTNAYRGYGTKQTPQSESIPGENQVKNSAGGFVYELDKWNYLDRFLILGSEGGTYYINEQKLTRGNADNVLKCIQEDGVRVVNRIVEISDAGRAPKNEPALFALAMCAGLGDEPLRLGDLQQLERAVILCLRPHAVI